MGRLALRRRGRGRPVPQRSARQGGPGARSSLTPCAPGPPCTGGDHLSTAERAALERRAAAHGLLDRGVVGRTVGLSLARRGLVMALSDCVLLTEAGMDLLADSTEQGHPHRRSRGE
jgi:hypothetical protein